MRVAFLTAACMRPGHSRLRADHWEHDREFVPMRAACASRGIDLVDAVWDDPALVPASFDAFVIGTTWDYQENAPEFLGALEAIAARRPLFNPLSVVRWNLAKTYLRDLAARGVPVVPTRWEEHADARSIAAAFDALDAAEIVVKPVVGASAWRQSRIRRSDPLPAPDDLPPAEAMIQPFLPAAVSEGEYAFVFFDGAFSHCALKMPAPGDYRVQSMFGGRERVHHPSAGELAQVRSVLDAVEEPLLYARIDMVRAPDGGLAVMELELVEPYLYPEQGPGMGEAFAEALLRRMRT